MIRFSLLKNENENKALGKTNNEGVEDMRKSKRNNRGKNNFIGRCHEKCLPFSLHIPVLSNPSSLIDCGVTSQWLQVKANIVRCNFSNKYWLSLLCCSLLEYRRQKASFRVGFGQVQWTLKHSWMKQMWSVKKGKEAIVHSKKTKYLQYVLKMS